MALRAGYYGLKKKFINKVNNWDKIVFPRDEQAVLGAKNIINPTLKLSGATAAALTITDNGNGTFELNGTAAASANLSIKGRDVANYGQYLPIGKYKYSINDDALIYVGTTYNGSYKALTGSVSREVSFEITADTTSDYKLADGSVLVALYMHIEKDDIYNHKVITPMIRLASDPDDTYVPYAMTNRELTASAVDQKTTINAIIAAATGAADFAAFKTAMGAITPVTRSLSKEASPEDVPEEVIEEEKPVTKKTTKKTTVKEGE